MNTRTFPDVPEAPGGSPTFPDSPGCLPGVLPVFFPFLPVMIFAGMMARMSTEVLKILKLLWTTLIIPVLSQINTAPHKPSCSFTVLPRPTHRALVRKRLRGSENDWNLVWPGHYCRLHNPGWDPGVANKERFRMPAGVREPHGKG